MDLKLADKVALVTGGSRGIGLRTARLLAEEGCHLGICGRGSADVAAAAAELRARGVRVTHVVADVTVPAEAATFVERCAAELGRIDILINNVGGSAGGLNVMETTDEEWLRTFELNPLQIARMAPLTAP